MFNHISRAGIDVVVPEKSLEEAEKYLEKAHIVWFTDQLELDSHSSEIESDRSFPLFLGLQKVRQNIHRTPTLSGCIQLLQRHANNEVFLIVTANMPLDETALCQLRSFINVKCIYHFGSVPPWKKPIGSTEQGQDRLSLPNSCLNILPDDVLTKALDEIDAETKAFIIHQLLLELLVHHSPNFGAREDFINFCEEVFYNDQVRLEQILKYKTQDIPKPSICCFTEKSFASSILNKTLRSYDLARAFQIRYFICDLYAELSKLHQDQWSDPLKRVAILTLFRGKNIPKAEFEQLQKSEGELAVINSFVSTSMCQDVALHFVDENDLARRIDVPVIFRMDINLSENCSKPLASIRSYSKMRDEYEFLLSMGIIFKIGSIVKYRVCHFRMRFHIDTTRSVLSSRTETCGRFASPEPQ